MQQIDSLIQQIKNITGLEDVPWQTFAELQVAGDYRVIEPLVNLFDGYSAGRETIEAVQQILVNFGLAAVPTLVKALESPDMETRYLATITLGMIADPQAIEPLIGRFKDEEHDVGREAGIALGNIGEPALAPILAALSSKDARTRQYAVLALNHFNDPKVDEALIKSLEDEAGWVRFRAATSVARTGFTAAVEPLMKRLTEETPPKTPQSGLSIEVFIKQTAATSLGIIGDRRAVEALNQALTDKDVAEEAAIALGLIGDERAIEPLIQALWTADSHSIRHYIVRALTRFGDTAKPSIKAALKDPEANVRFGAAMVLGNIGNYADLAELEQLAETDEGETFSRGKVKTASRKAVKRIKDSNSIGLNEYNIKTQDFINLPWLNMVPVNLGNVPPGLGTPDLYLTVKKLGQPFLLVNIYSVYGTGLPAESLVWHDWLFIGFGEALHVISLTTRQSFSHEIRWYCSGFHPLEDYLLVLTSVNILCFNKKANLLWLSEEVGIDGVQIEKVIENTIRGLGEWNPPDGWKPFELELTTGKSNYRIG